MTIASMPMMVLDPTAAPDAETISLARRPATLDGRRIGLLANGKVNADELLESVLKLLAERFKLGAVTRCNKRIASSPAPREIIEMLARECDVVLTSTGD